MRLLLLLAVTAPMWAQFGAARQVVNGNGAPNAAQCASANNVGMVYARKNGEAAFSTFYVCGNTAAGTYEWELMGSGGGGGGVSSVAATGGVQTSSGSAITTTGTVRGAHVANAQTGTTYTFLTGDRGKVVTFSNASSIAVTLPQAGTGFEDGWFVIAKNIGAGDVTITPTTSTISGTTAITVSLGEWVLITSNGTNYEGETNRLTVDSALSITRSRTSQQIGAGATLATLSGSQTLTNKDLSSATNSIGPNAIKAYVAGGGTAQAQTATLSPALPSYVAGGAVCWLPAAANTATAPTLNVNGLGAKTITKLGTTALVANDLTTTAVACAIYDGTQYQLQNPQVVSGSTPSISTTYSCQDDNLWPVVPGGSVTQGPCDLFTVIGTTGAISISDGESTAPGIITLTTGTGAGGSISISQQATSILLGGGSYTSTARLRVPTVSDGTETFTVRSGILDGNSAPVDGCYFEYTHSVNSGNWQSYCTSNSSSSSPINTAVAVSAGAWVVLEVVVNAAGTSAEFFINGSSQGTITTNIPTGAGRFTGFRPAVIVKSAGTTARTLQVDYEKFSYVLTSAR